MKAPQEIDWAVLYDVLALEPGASDRVIKGRYHALAKVYHPDAGTAPDEKAFKRINEAHAVLVDPATADKRDKWVDEYRRAKQPPQLRFAEQRISLGPIAIGTAKDYSLHVVNDGGTCTGTIDAHVDPPSDWVAIQVVVGGEEEDHLLTVRIMCRPHDGVPTGKQTLAVNVRHLSTIATAQVECDVVSAASARGPGVGAAHKPGPAPWATSAGGTGIMSAGSTSSGPSSSTRASLNEGVVKWIIGIPVFLVTLPHHHAGVTFFGRTAELVVGGVLDWLEAALGGWALLVVVILFIPAAAVGVVYVFLAVLWPVALAVMCGWWGAAALRNRL